MARTNVSRFTSSILCLLALVLNANFEFGTCITIEDPTFAWDGFRLNIDYQISESVVAEKVTYDIVSDKDCEGGVIDAEEIQSQLIEVSESRVRISLLINPTSIHGARYTKHHDDYAIVGVCSRIWINKPDDTFEPITATRDDYILIKAELEELDGIIEILGDKAKNWGVDVEMCDDKYRTIDNPPTIRNGEKLRLCARPTQRTINDGVTLGTIKSFYFEREGDIIQDAVATYGTDDATNVFECERGSTLCVIETVLKNDFFFGPGEVKGEGVFFMQWGKAEDDRRNLRSVEVKANIQRSLYEWYEQGEIVSEKVGKTMISIEPMNKVYKADAFACDDENKPSEVSTLNEADYLKICIKPNKEARAAGVYMNSLESWSFALANDDRSQEVIDSYGRVVQENMTQVDCSIGDSICSIDSTLSDWFFDKGATMVATGYAVLQFGEDRRRAQVSLDGLAFAGRDQIEAFFDTIGRDPEDEKSSSRQWFDDIFDQYNMTEKQVTALYIIAVVLIVLIVLCCFGGCVFFFWWGRGDRVKDEPEGRTQHINIKIDQEGKEITEFQDEQSQSTYNNDYPDGYANGYPRRNSNSSDNPPMSPRPRRNSNSSQGPMSPRPRRNSNSSQGPMSPRPRTRRGSNSSDVQKTPRTPRSKHSSDGEKTPRSTHSRKTPRTPRSKYSSDGQKTPRSPHSRKTPRSTHSRRGDSNSDHPRSPHPKTRRHSNDSNLSDAPKTPRTPRSKYSSDGQKTPRSTHSRKTPRSTHSRSPNPKIRPTSNPLVD